ncbi:MAG: CoA-binding protein [Proteobacteria bacterium]|nr:CoA-binding protein [Pseudomonadota bacterium]NIS67510.1 CoA-binding protein [Pseudomonadota bacterium]
MIDEEIKDVLRESKNIAVVGLSPKQDRPSFRVASYLKAKGYKIIPVRPGMEEVLGEKAYPRLTDIPSEIEIDVVDIFRRSEEVLPVVEEAIARKAKTVWMQEGIINEEAARKAEAAGLKVVMDRCMLKEHQRL